MAPKGALGMCVRALAIVAALAGPSAAVDSPERNPTGFALLSPCEANCAVAVYAGPFIDNSMAEVLYQDPRTPFTWDYRRSDMLLGLAVSRYAATILRRIDLEPELGIGQRIGRQDEAELWGALFFRYRGFPWDDVLVTSFAVSTGLNYATGISEVERERAEGRSRAPSRLQHYFAPEITFALPDRPDVELLFRFHHRSGLMGVVSDSGGGAHYGTVGLRWRF